MIRMVLALSVVLLGFGCGGESPTAPTPVATAALTDEVRLAMQEAIADEYRAETIYQGVVNDFGGVLPFINILSAEQRHSATIARLFTSPGLPVPANTWTVATVPHYPSVPAACAAGVVAERENIAIYERYMGLALQQDVRQVFESNRAASLNNHLPAFEQCAR